MRSRKWKCRRRRGRDASLSVDDGQATCDRPGSPDARRAWRVLGRDLHHAFFLFAFSATRRATPSTLVRRVLLRRRGGHLDDAARPEAERLAARADLVDEVRGARAGVVRALWKALAKRGCLSSHSRTCSMVWPVRPSASSSSFCAGCLALNSCICTRLWTLTAPSPLVSIGRKIACGYSSVISDWTPSDTDERRHAAERLHRDGHVDLAAWRRSGSACRPPCGPRRRGDRCRSNACAISAISSMSGRW